MQEHQKIGSQSYLTSDDILLSKQSINDLIDKDKRFYIISRESINDGNGEELEIPQDFYECADT